MASNVRDVVRKQGTMPTERPAKLQDFVRVTPDTKLGLYTYAFLMPLMGMWSILSAMLNPKGMKKVLVMLKQFATLAWLRGDRVVALHVEGMSVDALLARLRAGGAILHLGATSTDIEDNGDALRLRASLDLLLASLAGLLRLLSSLVEKWADIPLMAFTHLQPAEPTTLGYRLAQYAQDLLADWEDLRA